MKPQKHDVKKQTTTYNTQNKKRSINTIEAVQSSHVPISIEEQLEAFADLLIDHFLKNCHEKE